MLVAWELPRIFMRPARCEAPDTGGLFAGIHGVPRRSPPRRFSLCLLTIASMRARLTPLQGRALNPRRPALGGRGVMAKPLGTRIPRSPRAVHLPQRRSLVANFGDVVEPRLLEPAALAFFWLCRPCLLKLTLFSTRVAALLCTTGHSRLSSSGVLNSHNSRIKGRR